MWKSFSLDFDLPDDDALQMQSPSSFTAQLKRGHVLIFFFFPFLMYLVVGTD